MTHHDHIYVPGSLPGKVLVLFHGTGGDEHSLIQAAHAIAPGWSKLGVRGQVLENGANRYFRRYAEGVFDEADVKQRTDDLSEWLRGPNHPWHGQALHGIGYSNGANMVANLLLQGQEALSSSVMLRPSLSSAPAEGLNLANTKIQLQLGQVDDICPPSLGLKLAGILEQAGAETIVKQMEAGHNLIRQDFDLAAEFLATL